MEFIPDISEDFVAEGQLSENDAETAIKPEDTIPDLPENQAARAFLKSAPQKGLFMPLGKEVKVMQCWRCKAYGHRTGDRECPLRISGNLIVESERRSREDPMNNFGNAKEKQRAEKYKRVALMKELLEEIRIEENERKKMKKERKEKKRKKRKV